MTSRKRPYFSKSSDESSRRSFGRRARAARGKGDSRERRRRQTLETLEARQLLAGPQLIGIQPNEGALIEQGTILETAPRSLVFRFDEGQQIDPQTLEAIRITRSGPDGQFDTTDDVQVIPGAVALGDTADDEVVVRFADSLPDDDYRIEVFGFDDPGRQIVGLRNLDGDPLAPREGAQGVERVEFSLRLGAQIESIVPQPIVRLEDGSLQQRRDEILIYFNEDELFVENDPATGLPTERSAENPRFYQLLLTRDTVRTTDDLLYQPERVVYDAATHTARLIFAGDDINQLPGVPVEGGTFRLRLGTAVDSRADLIIEPTRFDVVPRVSSNLGVAADLQVTFESKVLGEADGNRTIRFVDGGSGGLTVALDSVTGDVVFDFGGAAPNVGDLRAVVEATPQVDSVMSVRFARGGVPGTGSGLTLPAAVIDAPPLTMAAAGDTLTTATNVGTFGEAGEQLSSLLIAESISPHPYDIQLPGSPNDPGRAGTAGVAGSGLARAINELFGPDVTDGITEIEYNFRSIYSGGAGASAPAFLNNITEIQKRRIREAISLWASSVGVQFRETQNSGITFAVGTRSGLAPVQGTELREIEELDAALRIDPDFEQSAIVFSNQTSFGLNYGEDFFRKAMAGIGFLLGLERNDEVTAQTLMALDPAFLEGTINPDSFVAPVDPFEPTQTTFQQSINPEIDAQTIGDPVPNALEGPEPVFPGNQDILHGQFLHRPDGRDIDLYRFEVSLGEGREFGTLTAETFAQRLSDSSLLDTTLTLFEEESASATTSFGLGAAVSVQIDSRLAGELGNRSRIEFIRSSRGTGDTSVRVSRVLGDDGQPLSNVIEVDIPRRGPGVTSVSVQQIVDAMNANAFASTLFDVSVRGGDAAADVSGVSLDSFAPIRLSGGGIVPVTRNDDYFSNDSFLSAKLTGGVYFVGVSASGNEDYDPARSGTGNGGRTEGDYELLLKFEPQVSQTDVIRDLDSDREGVPGTAIDGDLDGTPGGVKNFWFQTRPTDRILRVGSNGSGITPGQTMTVTSGSGVVRRFEFVPVGSTPRFGNVAIPYNPGPAAATSPNGLALAITSAINSVTSDTGASASTPSGTDRVVLFGERSLQFSSNFRSIEALGRTLFVDKVASVVADGSLSQPFNNIAGQGQSGAFASALPGDIVRVVGNGGQDADLSTAGDNFAYQVGLAESGGTVLPDGRHLDVPRGVTMMVDAGAAFKLRGAAINIGSNSLTANRNGAALQVLGTPRLVHVTDPTPIGADEPDPGIASLGGSGSVVFTSTRDRSVDAAASGNRPQPSDGDWGGIIFRRDFDQAEGRSNLEDQGIFLQHVNHAEMRYGGGSNIIINSSQQAVNPIQMIDLRPTVTFNRLTDNASAAMSASPKSFQETRFQQPRFQQAGAFTADYGRVGPDIKNNRLINNSINGLFIRTQDSGSVNPREITVAARFDDIDIVHYIAENVVVAGNPGGPIRDGFSPSFGELTVQLTPGGSLPTGNYRYRMTFVDANGFESLASDESEAAMASASARTVQLLNLPTVSGASDYVSRRLYRLDPGGTEYRLIAELNRSSTDFDDDGSNAGGAPLDLSRSGVRGRLDGSLVVDPGAVVKFRGARIELGQGSQVLAEGLAGRPIVFTSALDDRFGAGGTFDTNNDAGTAAGNFDPSRGDWSGFYAGPRANVSFDHAVVAYGGGVSLVEGGQSRGFGALELHQATARVTNSRFEFNDNAQDGSGPVGRSGRLAVTPATIFARGTQPVIVGNEFVENYGSIIDIDLGSMTDELIRDTGRQSGPIDRLVGLDDNHGPLVRGNTTESTPGEEFGRRQLNGLRIRGGELTSDSVWDDTDIVHVLFDTVVVGNQTSGGALALKSRPDESLVIKLLGGGTPNSATAGTGFTATGSSGDIADRIGGTIHVLGLPGSPVVFTSLMDDSVGAGRRTDGAAQTDTNGDGIGSRPSSNDWRSLYFDGLSNDRNVAAISEQELATAAPPGLNGTVNNAQSLGDLAERLTAGDERFRLGLDVRGFLTGPGDIDTYAFTAVAGTQVWFDLDDTSFDLDGVIEVVDEEGNVFVRSVNGFDEFADPSRLQVNGSNLLAGSLGDPDNPLTKTWASGLYADDGSTNPRDAGLRMTMPGEPGTRSRYFVRVRGASTDPGDTAGGVGGGAYRLQLRLREAQEFPGSVVQFADIRFANHGIHAQGLPGSSPLLGEVQEHESADPSVDGLNFGPIIGGYGRFVDEGPAYPTDVYSDNGSLIGGSYAPVDPIFGATQPLASRPQYLGNLVDSKTGTISVGGSLFDSSDVDFYRFDLSPEVVRTGVHRSTVFDIDYADGFDRPDTNLSVFYSPSGNPAEAQLVFFGEDSSILDDRSSPLAGDEVGELLSRGSSGAGDAFIGPVSLPAGSYFVAVTERGRVPDEIRNNPQVRREPLASVRRIFDDHIESIGGSTADAPREGAFVADTSDGWAITTDRSTDPGRDRSAPFANGAAASGTGVTDAIANPGNGGDAGDDSNELLHIDPPSFDSERILLAFRKGVDSAQQAAILQDHGLEKVREFESIGGLLVTTTDSRDVIETIEELLELDEVRYAEPDYIKEPAAVPDDPQFGNMWGLNNTGQTGGTPGADISATEAWDTFTGASDAVIAVLDSGVDYDHPDLVDNMWVNPGEIPGNGIDDDGNGYVDDVYGIDPGEGDTDPMDNDGHGTHVAGTTAATGNNGVGVTGVNWDAGIMALKVGNAGGGIPTSAVIEALEYIVTMKTQYGVNIVVSNNSYGGPGFSQAEMDAIQSSIDVGVPFVAAAGNDAFSNDIFPQYPASYPLDGIIAVASTDHNDQLSGFSNFGVTSVDVAAPGSQILSTTLGGGYGNLSGTSMASPHVAGVVGLLAGAYPSATVADLKMAVMLGADRLPSLVGTTVTDARLNAAQSLAILPLLLGANEDNESIRFDRSAGTGVLTSNEFDLTGYAAADLPRFYFDFFLDAAPGDTVTVQARSNEQPGPVELDFDLDDPANFGGWRQAVASLSGFAGDSGVVIEFRYEVDAGNVSAEGLYLDNFVVGFAERGEKVSNARGGRGDFTGAGGDTSGKYQLEIRPGSEYSQALPGGVIVERALADAPRLIDPVYLSFPDGRSIVPYETFSFEVLNTDTDENETLTFQFRPTEANRQDASRVDPNAIAVPFSVTDPADGPIFGVSIVNAVVTAIRGLENYAIFSAEPRDQQLLASFDTNDRHLQEVTLVAPSGDQIDQVVQSEGRARFTLGDGSNQITFEFSATPTVSFGSIRIPYSPSDTSAEIARRLITVINSGTVQARIGIRGSTSAGHWNFAGGDPAPSDGRVALHGLAVGTFAPVDGPSDPTLADPITTTDDGQLILSAIFHDGIGDQNTVRTQGQFIVDSNRVSDSHAIGIWSDVGPRGRDPDDDRSIANSVAGNLFLDPPPIGNSQLGAALNLPTQNDAVVGGLAPGMVVTNNIVDQAGYAGVKVDGETRPFVIEWNGDGSNWASGNTVLQSRADILVPDGFIFAVDAGGTRVVFEFEDVSGAPTNLGGSGNIGGDGFVDGHVPVYYRLGQGVGNNRYNPSGPDPIRSFGYSAHELMMAMYESIQGSILVTNGLVELVRPTLGPSVNNPQGPRFRAIDEDPIGQSIGASTLDHPNPAMYLEGVTGIYTSRAFQKQARTPQLNFFGTGFDSVTGETSNPAAPMLPISEAPQPLARVINNTIYGADGTEGAILPDGSLSRAIGAPTDESNDTFADAVDTKVGRSHRGAYIADGMIGDNVGLLAPAQDVDLFKVELSVGERLIVDIDTPDDGPTTALRLFDSSGVEVAIGELGALATYLKPGSTVEFPSADTDNGRDGFIDFTARKTDTYYVGVSSAGNDQYEGLSLSGRVAGDGGTGDYTIGIEALAPRSYTLSLDNHPLTPFDAEVTSGGINGTLAEGGPAGAGSLVGTTFTISQIPDYLIPTRPGDAYANVNADGNRVTFEFTSGVNSIVLGNGNINVPILTTNFMGAGGYRVPDIMRAIANAINGYLNNPALPNHEVGNGPDGQDGPITRVQARAMGGSQTDNVGIRNFVREVGFPFPPSPGGGLEFTSGFGHDRRESGSTASIVPDGTFTDGRGSTELYVLVKNAAKFEISPEARAAGLKLGPDNSRDANGDPREPDYATASDQLLTEFGIQVGGGSSASLLNNVIVNAHQSIAQEETSVFGFGGRIDGNNPDLNPKPGQVVSTGNAIQYDEQRNTQIRSDVSWWVQAGTNVINRNPALDGSISTDLRTGPSNVAGGNSDFNFVVIPEGTPGQVPGGFIVRTFDDLFENAAGNRFTPAPQSPVIDSAVDSIDENTALANLKASVGIPSGTIFAPERDNSGQLRADEPTMSPPSGIGSNVFKDRGALDRADFVGPVASLEVPFDNDVAGLDSDPSVSFVQRNVGIFDEFRILVQDLGHTTVVVPPIEGLRSRGANLVLFENDEVLEEGVDYTFHFDETRGLITLRPLAGVWRSDRAYRVSINNRDRTAMVAPGSRQVSDGDQITITDEDGARLVFEFETGYQIRVPEALSLIVPRAGTNAGGVVDGDVFQINDGVNPVVTFEFNNDSVTLPGTVQIPLPTRPTPVGEDELQAFLGEIAQEIDDAITAVADQGSLDVSVRVIDNRVVIGSEPGTTLVTSNSGLRQAAPTLALRVPNAGVGGAGVQDGDLFVVNDGERSLTFEFDSGGGISSTAFVPVPISAGMVAGQVAAQVADAINGSALGLSTTASGGLVLLNLPTEGFANIPSGRLSVIGVSRTAVDGDLLILTPADGGPDVTLEINRTDEPDANGDPIDDGVTDPNVPLDVSRLTTAEEFAELIASTLRSLEIDGLDPNVIETASGGLVSVGGEEGLGLRAGGVSLDVSGSPGVTQSSTIRIFGPLLMQVPSTGGAALTDGSVLIVRDDAGIDTLFEFNVAGTGSTVAGAVVIDFNRTDDVDTLTDLLVAAIDGAGIGIDAENLGDGLLSFGRVADDRVSTAGLPAQGIPGVLEFAVRRGNVSDGERLTIRQGDVEVTYEFEAISIGGGVGTGNVAVPFLPGSTLGNVATSLAGAINNNRRGLQVTATAEIDANGNPTGNVLLDDRPGTVVDVSAADTLSLSGVPGGAIPIFISPAFSSIAVKQALVRAINSVNRPGEPAVTTLTAQDRGGATLFIENGQLFEGPAESFFLPAVKDLAGNLLQPNRSDNSTQFTILLPTVGLDFGDAPDVGGQYPTLLENDGARHVITPDLMLGTRVDAEPDGQPTPGADGDDLFISISDSGTLFETSVTNGVAQIRLDDSVDPTTRDGDTISIAVGDRTETFEFDLDGIFLEENFAITPQDPTSAASIAAAIRAAINESPLAPAEVAVDGDTVSVFGDDEDGVSFISDVNPNGNLNRFVDTPVSVTVSGTGVLEAWIDFNGDGDWNDPGEQIISATTPGAVFTDAGEPTTRVFTVRVPDTTTVPPTSVVSQTRFRISREGGLSPNGLALSGEVEDYAVRLVPGGAPVVGESQANRDFTTPEDVTLQALDATGNLTPSPEDNGILDGITDPDGQGVAVYHEDIGIRQLETEDGVPAGELDLNSDGTFTFQPFDDFFGTVNFTARVTDVRPTSPEAQLVSSTPINVTLEVTPVNDPPLAVVTPVSFEVEIDEDQVTTFTAADLIDPFFVPGPANESGQPMFFGSVGSGGTPFVTELGGSLTISPDGGSVTYTPPADFNSETVRDRFTYTVGDAPGADQLSQVSTTEGMVEILINAVNDPPRPGDDTFPTLEEEPITIAIGGPQGILANDTPGPQDEIDDGQTVSFVSAAQTSFRGGSVVRVGDTLVYTPPAAFSGQDRFEYTLQDSLGATATGTVLINVDDINNPPTFVGVNGIPGADQLTYDESKEEPRVVQFDLATWFSDPDDDTLTFDVDSSDPDVVIASRDGNSLRLEMPPLAFGTSTLTITATDALDQSATGVVTVGVTNVPDSPVVTGSLGPIDVDENEMIVRVLSDVFSDPDGDQLQYSVARIGNLLNPTPQQIANHPLIRSITLTGGEMRIELEPNRSGSEEIEISATDGLFTVSDSFQLNVASVPDAPIGGNDSYEVRLGSELRVLNPAEGLLANDSDPDGDAFQVQLSSVTEPSNGTLEVNADGTFIYSSSGGTLGETDQFSYRLIDSTGLVSDPINVTLTLTQSRFQNPTPNGRWDVTADGFVTPIDALRIINLLNRVSGGASSVPVSELGTTPPDYYDVNGDGRVSTLDALQVINEIQRRQPVFGGEGEGGGEGESAPVTARLANTTAYATPSTQNLPIRNLEPSAEPVPESKNRDALLAGGVEIMQPNQTSQLDWVTDEPSESSPDGVDEALSLLLDEAFLD